jgi:hypothetical protein
MFATHCSQAPMHRWGAKAVTACPWDAATGGDEEDDSRKRWGISELTLWAEM